MATSDPAMAPTSTSMWPASARRTRELEATAAATSNTMKVTSSSSAVVRARRSVSTEGCPAWEWGRPCPCRSVMGRHVVSVGQHFLDEPAHMRVVEHVEDAGAFTPAADQTGQPELG